jgi:uncharacterized membrane protein HdeD (DUF308 family)
MSPFGSRWRLGVTGAVVVTAGIALVLVDWTIAQLTAFVATVLVAHGALHITTTTFEGVPGALGMLQGGAEIAAGIVLLAWPHPTLLVLTVVVGALVLVQAIVDATIIASIRNQHPCWRARIVADIVQVLLGVALITRPAGTVRATSLTIGALAILAGGVEIAAALSQRPPPRQAVSVS